jgi:lycopene beta-cyclase
MPTHYDYILAGGGSAGLALADHLAHSPLRERTMLIVDQDAKDQNDRTWCFWTTQPTRVDEIVHHTWERLQFVGDGFQRVFDLAPYRYKMVRGLDFYRHMRGDLAQRPNVTLLQGHIERVEDGTARAQVVVDGQPFTADWVFDSRFIAAEFQTDTTRYHYLKQHFLGWLVETPEARFDPHTATLFDFRTPQKGVMRFMYVLPLTERQALVEYTLFSAEQLPDEEYRQALVAYLRDGLEIQDYRVLEEEKGLIPMTDQPFPRRAGQRILNTGTRGGRVKGSTGFAFLRTQRDAAAIVASLVAHGHPFDLPADPARYRFFDAVMLQVLYRHGDLAEAIYTALFKRNPVGRLLRFLDEQGGWIENLQVLATVPTWPFVESWVRYKLLRRI